MQTKSPTAESDDARPLTAVDLLVRDVHTDKTVVFMADPVIGWYLCGPTIGFLCLSVPLAAAGAVHLGALTLGAAPASALSVAIAVIALVAAAVSYLATRLFRVALRQARMGEVLHVGPEGLKVPGAELAVRWDEIEEVVYRDFLFFAVFARLIVRVKADGARPAHDLSAFVGLNSASPLVIEPVLQAARERYLAAPEEGA
ncbi:hypothetical protein KAJ83_16030 [Marivibrio halodurans]|uniref:Uncharacterized protein n=1 Tax=Marivibrio halodurans TaxID=2039722 RepID=A0A8J7SPS7_9PROT|nr:hypothetical protein [Marivibrio halodurans]MBP5858531.1 hypothetical protein [Marivibrio halodurans]